MLRGVIPLARPFLGDEEAAAVREVLRSGTMVQGPRATELEARIGKWCCRKHAVALSSGTSALYLAVEALGIGPGDHVLCPDLTWPSPAHAVIRHGALPVLADVDPDEWNATPEAFCSARTAETRAAIVIDQFGNPARADEVAKALPGVAIIADAACSLGSFVADTPCGAMGAVACMSFHPRKVITTGEGGMCLTDDDELAARLRMLRNHGVDRTGVDFEQASGNFRMSEPAAAIGMAQMSRLEAMVEERRQLGARYLELLSGLPGLGFQREPAGCRSNYQTFGVVLPAELSGRKRDGVIQALRENGVEAGRLSFALHRLGSLGPAARQAESAGRSLEVSDAIAQRGLALPLYVSMTAAEQEQVARALKKVLS
jgi:perosamine synthetase